MGKSVWDLAVMMEALTGYSYQQYTEPSYTDITRYRLGIPRKHFAANDCSNYGLPYPDRIQQEAIAIFDRVSKVLAPAIALDPADLKGIERLWEEEAEQDAKTTDHKGWNNGPNQKLMMVEYYEALNAYLGTRGNDEVRDMESLVRWNEQNPVSLASFHVVGITELTVDPCIPRPGQSTAR
jgi:hypothetical protein